MTDDNPRTPTRFAAHSSACGMRTIFLFLTTYGPVFTLLSRSFCVPKGSTLKLRGTYRSAWRSGSSVWHIFVTSRSRVHLRALLLDLELLTLPQKSAPVRQFVHLASLGQAITCLGLWIFGWLAIALAFALACLSASLSFDCGLAASLTLMHAASCMIVSTS